MTIHLCRDAGHPWSRATGWDQLRICAPDGDALEARVAEAGAKRWRVWIRDQLNHTALMYKPSGATGAWEDDPRLGTPKSLCTAVAVGEQVYTDYSGCITEHTVVERATGQMTQTGVTLRVRPPVPGSAFRGDNGKIHNNAWLDCAWFRPAG